MEWDITRCHFIRDNRVLETVAHKVLGKQFEVRS